MKLIETHARAFLALIILSIDSVHSLWKAPSGKSKNKVCETQEKKKEKVCKIADVAKIVYSLAENI